MANSRSGLEGGLAGLKAVERIATMFGLHDAQKIRGRLVWRLLLPQAPFHKEAVAKAPQHRHQPHRPGPTHPAGVFPMGDVQALVQAAFNAPGGPSVRQPWGGGQFRRWQAGYQSHHFRGVLAQVSAQEGHLRHQGKSHRLRAGRPRAQHTHLGLALVDLTLAGQGGRRLPRGKNAPAAPPPVVGCSLAAWVGCP